MESSFLSSQKLHRRTMFHENLNFLSSRSHNPKEVTTLTIPRILKDNRIQRMMTITAMKERSVAPAAVTTGIATIAPPLSSLSNANRGIGVVEFLHGKTYFITGGTGFLGKALIEKILRTVPHISKIFVLIMAKSEGEAMNRLKNDIIYSELFKCLRQMYGKKFEAFVLSKLVPVVGNVCENGLGMEEACAREISQEADVFIHSAANTTFDERYDTALITNTRGPYEITSFAKKCNNLLVLLHVSTTYVNGEREGIIVEKPFEVGHNIKMESTTTSDTSTISNSILDVNAELKLALALSDGSPDQTTQRLKELGTERAKSFGWHNTYEFTKAMGEMVVNSMRGDIPVVILRPSVITSSYKDPFPGWIQGNRMADPLLVSYGKGKLPGFTADPQVVIDVIPVDMVVNAMLCAIATHGSGNISRKMFIYQVGSSMANPLQFGELFRFARKHFTSCPFVDSRGKSINVGEMNFFDTIEKFTKYIGNGIGAENELMSKKIADHALHLARIYEPYMFYGGRFDNGNTQKLVEAMSIEELKSFDCDVRGIEWKDYVSNIHLPGLRKHVLKGR